MAQRRRRVFVVGVRAGDGIHPGAVLFEWERLPRDSAPGREAGSGVARAITSSTGGASAKEQHLTFVSGTGEPLNALSTDPDTLCMAHGQGGAEVRRGQCPTLSCNHEAPIAFSAKDGGGDAGEIAPTLRAMPHDKSHMNGGGQMAVAHTLRGEGHDASEDGTGRGVPLAVALRGRENGNTAELGDETAHALRSGSGGSDKPHVLAEMAVRRLTPRECERLQGLPDDYTLIPFGKAGKRKDIEAMAAYWGVTVEAAAELAADSHRYRAIGNGMAAPVVRWIGRRIERVLRMTETFGAEERP